MAKVKLLKKIAAIYLNYGSKGLKKALKNKIKGRKALDGFGLGLNTSSTNTGIFNYEIPFKSPSDNLSDLESLKKLIDDKNIKVVSFDIFDTLLVRPVIEPKDVFYLVANKVKRKFNLDFIALRGQAEQELGNPNATIHDIYAWIARKHHLSIDVCNALKHEEIEVEKNLLFKRKQIFSIYQYALKAGKRVIATSDMYLTEEILTDILQSKQYTDIQKVYVSNAFSKRKDTGNLFDEVLSQENCSPNEMIHIGDNLHSDYQVPMRKGIVAFHYPSVVEAILKPNTLWFQTYLGQLEDDPFVRLIVGYVLHHYEDIILQTPHLFKDCSSLGCLGIGPVMLAAMLKVLNDGHIQDQYSKVHFASRDGYLAQKVYETLRTVIPNSIGSEYFQAGRILYYPSLHDTFDSFIKPELHGSTINVNSFINSYIRSPLFKEAMLDKLNDDEKMTENTNTQKWKKVLEKCRPIIEEYIDVSKANLQKYYTKVFGLDKKVIVFDCGYSGSISTSLANIFKGKQFNKLYLWETGKNKQLDQKNGTKTHCLIGDLNFHQYRALHLMFEELLSPVMQRAVYVDDSGNPVFIEEKCSSLMLRDMSDCQNGVLDCCKDFVALFKDYAQDFSILSIEPLLSGLNYSMHYSPYCESALLKNICFPDDAIGVYDSLAKKIERHRNYVYPVVGTGLANPDNYLKESDVFPVIKKDWSSTKIGVHLHLYDQSLAWEMVSYLNNLPSHTDIYITTPKQGVVKQLESIFSQSCGFKNKPQIILLENRGRDVAPWLVGMKNIQDKYDIFCHVHGKRSNQNALEGELWRKYLFDNLLSRKAIDEILSIFESHPTVGSIFPGPYHHIYNMWRNCGVNVIGENERLLTELVNKLSQHEREVLRSDLFFSVGTMLWYRPKALNSLFNLGLSLEDFPKEPIGIDGSTAHALERIIKIACETDGYSAKAWTSMHREKTLGYMHS